MKRFIKNTLFIGVLLVGVTEIKAQAPTPQQLPMVEIPTPRQIPALTGNPDQDAEILLLKQRDEQEFQGFQLKYEEMLKDYNADARAYLYTMGFPQLTYKGNAMLDWMSFESAFKQWHQAHSADLHLIAAKAAQIQQQTSSVNQIKE